MLLRSSESFTELALTFRSLSHFELSWYVASGKDPVSFIRMWMLSCPRHHLLKILVSPPLSCPDSSVKKELAVDVRVPVWTPDSLPLVCMSVFRPVPLCLNYGSFAVNFEIKKCASSNFVIFKTCFDYSGSLAVPHAFLDLACHSLPGVGLWGDC